MGTFQDDTAVTKVDGKLTATLSRDWEIWGPSGGYVASVALRAAGASAPANHRPATYSCQYLSAGPFGPIRIEAEPVRQGRNVSCINVALMDGDKCFLQAQVWTTNKSDGPHKIDCAMRDVPKPKALRSVEDFLPPGTPPHPFWKHFESKHVDFIGWEDGQFDKRGGVAEQWHKLRDFDAGGNAFLDCARPLLLIDTLPWPAFHRGFEIKPDYIAPTLDLTVWFHDLPGPAEWLFCDCHSDVAVGGLIHGRVRVWSEDGRILATGGSNLLHVVRRG
jgi:acyl-CoA thioesterase-2